MFAEFLKPMKDKDRLKHKGYATIMTNFGGLNLELHADRAPKTVYNFIMLAKEGKYDDVSFHRLIPGFMVSFKPRPRLSADSKDSRRRSYRDWLRREVILGRTFPG
jgi:hypothetical protein